MSLFAIQFLQQFSVVLMSMGVMYILAVFLDKLKRDFDDGKYILNGVLNVVAMLLVSLAIATIKYWS